MNTVVNKMKTSMLILFAVGSALADIAPLYTTQNDMPGDAPIMTNTQEYVDAKVAAVPAPGNYAAVSNAAMNAVQSQSMTNYATRAELDAGWWSDWTVAVTTATNISVTGLPFYQPHDQHHDENYGWFLPTSDGDLSFYVLDEDADTLAIDKAQDGWVLKYTATRHRVSAPVPMKPSDIGAASTNDVTLTPIYSDGTPTYSDEWSYAGLPQGWHVQFLSYNQDVEGDHGWFLQITNTYGTADYSYVEEYESAVELTFSFYDSVTATVTAFKTRTDIIGYTLGDQTDKVIAAPGTVSNIVTKAYVEDLGIKGGGSELEDPVRHCTWVQCVTNGVFYWIVKEEP